MCNICKCVSWGIDIIQRILTFALACWIFGVICVGVIVASSAGIAYGYNFMLAEYQSLSQGSNISVFVRHGQFYENPVESEELSSTASEDTEVQSGTGSLSDAWPNAMGYRKFAQKLTKYSHTGGIQDDGITKNPGYMDESPTSKRFTNVVHLTRVFSVPKPAMKTNVPTGRTDVLMRNYDSIQKQTPGSLRDLVHPETEQLNHESNKFISYPTKSKHKERRPDFKIKLYDLPKSRIILPLWSDTQSSPAEYPAEEMDEDNVVYKPV